MFAVADGTVVGMINTIAESEEMLKRPDESDEAYLQRLIQYQQGLIMQGFEAILGNHVIVKHANDEYSVYAHLKTGSVTVSVGQQVTKGMKIGEVGNSGNSTEPHLHFHLTTKPEMKGARSLPIQFENIRIWPEDDGRVRHLHTGHIISTK